MRHCLSDVEIRQVLEEIETNDDSSDISVNKSLSGGSNNENEETLAEEHSDIDTEFTDIYCMYSKLGQSKKNRFQDFLFHL